MIKYIHRVAYAIFPALIPEPKQPKPPVTLIFDSRLEQAKGDLAQLHVQRALLRGEELRLRCIIDEYTLSRAFFAEREGGSHE